MNESIDFLKPFAFIDTLGLDVRANDTEIDWFEVWFTKRVDRSIEIITIACQHIFVAFDLMLATTAGLNYATPSLTQNISIRLGAEPFASILAYAPPSFYDAQ